MNAQLRPSARVLRALLKTVLAGVAVLACTPASTLGAQEHAFSSGFGSSGSAAGQMLVIAGSQEVAGSGVAVNDETHDVYVADSGNDRVDEFSSGGVLIRAWGFGVLNGKEELQSCTATCERGLAGTKPGELETPVFVAVDNSCALHTPALSEVTTPKCSEFDPSNGDVYVAVAGQLAESPGNLVSKFTAVGALVASWGDNGPSEAADGQLAGPKGEPAARFGQPAGITVDSAGNLWVYLGGTVNAGGAHMYEFGQAGSFEPPSLEEAGGFSPQGVAVSGAGALYISQNAKAVVELGVQGSVFEGPVAGFALDTADGDLLVDEGGLAIVDVFGCVPVSGGCPFAQTFGSPQLDKAAGVAADANGTVYAANTAVNEIAVFPVTLEAVVSAATGVHATSATLNGEVNPKGTEVTGCVFQYGRTTAYGQNAPCVTEHGEPIGKGSTPVKVHAEIAGLTGGSEYHYRLRVTNANGEELHSEDATPPLETLATAVIESPASVLHEVSASEVSAVLSAQVNPEGVTGTTCMIEYGVLEPAAPDAYSSSAGCEPPGLGEGKTPVAVSLGVSGLDPETTYHWRVVVKDANGTVTGVENTFIFRPVPASQDCGNEALREENNSTLLPDCRAYEMVSPAQKNAALLVTPLLGLIPEIAEDGERMIVSSVQCFAGSPSCVGDRASKGPPFEFARSQAGWVTQPLGAPTSMFETSSVWQYSADSGMVLDSAPIPGGNSDEFYARTPEGAFQPIGPIAEHEPYTTIEPSFHAATRDLSHLVYESGHPLWAFDASEGQDVYEYAGGGHTRPLLVGVSGGEGSEELISVCGTLVGSNSGAVAEALSGDGKTVYVSVKKCARGSGPANEHTVVPAEEVYARIDGEGAGARSVLVSGRSPSECSGPCASSPPAAAFFEGASVDGSVAVFTSTQRLVNSASEDPRGGDSAAGGGCAATRAVNGCNLYVFEGAQEQPLSGHNLVDASAGDTSGGGPRVQGVMGVSGDGSHVYFVARGVLAGTNRAGVEPVEGADNLYVYERDVAHPAGRTVFIATLPGEADNERAEWVERGFEAPDVTPDGGFLVFTSHGALTADASVGGPGQVYRYDAESELLSRVSIGAQGFDDDGNAGAGEASVVPPRAEVTQPRRDPTMSDDGVFVFFRSPVALTPGALSDVQIDGRGDLAENVYEWEAEGAVVDGRVVCGEAAGCVSLISDGHDVTEDNGSSVELIGSDTTGENVFFATADPLIASDTDSELDYYDARVNGGFNQTTPPAACEHEASCPGTPSAPATLGGLASTVFSGAGNLVEKVTPPPPAPRVLTRAQKLTKALKACKGDKKHAKRVACEKEARKRYGPIKKNAKKASKAEGALQTGNSGRGTQ